MQKDQFQALLPRSVVFVSKQSARLKPALDEAVRALQCSLDKVVEVENYSVAELLLIAEVGDSPAPEVFNPRDKDKEETAFCVLITELELLTLKFVSNVACSAVKAWLEKLLQRGYFIFATFWTALDTELSDYRIQKLFSRVVHLKEESRAFPSVLLQSTLVSENFWEGFVGYDEVKRSLDRLVRWRWHHFDRLEDMGISSGSNGVLLYGPSGCGKTFIAQKLGKESGIEFICLKASDIFSKWFGESEKAIRSAFQLARLRRPSILFLDEVDVMAPSRKAANAENNSVASRVLSTLLNELDGVDSENVNIVIMAATNRIDAVDDAILRPGRLGSRVLVGYPTGDDRLSLFKYFLRDTPLANDVDFSDLISRSFGLTVASIENLCSVAAFSALEENLMVVTKSHFDRSFQGI